MTFVSAVLVVVVGSFVCWVARRSWGHRRRILLMLQGGWRGAEAWVRARLLLRLRRQVLARAAALGVPLPVQAVGGRPRVVTWSNGDQRFYWPDMDSYRRAMEAGRTPLGRSAWNEEPPTPIETWSRAKLRAWLGQQAQLDQ